MHEEPINLLGIPPEDWAKTPETVRLAVHALLNIVQAQSAELKELKARVRELEARLGQNSQNSSRPPSSDPPSAPPQPPKVPRGRTAGAQPGHQGHQRPLVPPERVDEPVELLPEHCPDCQTVFPDDLPTLGTPRRTQVWELPEIRPHITEYRQHTRCCPNCRHLVTAALPPGAPPGALGPRATALISLLRGEYRLSLDDTVAFLAQVCNLPLSPGCVVTSCGRVSEALDPVYSDIQAAVRASSESNVDETGWRLPEKDGWLWVAVSRLATCFRLHPSRGHDGLRAVVGPKYRGIVISDRLQTYSLLADGQRQLCWAHLLRDLRGLDELYGSETGWARGVLTSAGDLFLLWHLYKGGWLDRAQLQDAVAILRLRLHEQLVAGLGSPHAKVAVFSRDLLKHWEALFTFTRVEGVEPTNNAAERALRHAVLWRKGSFGSRSEEGCRFVERMLSVRATCVQQGRNLFAFLTEALSKAWAAQPAPRLVQALESA
jgi:transposase